MTENKALKIVRDLVSNCGNLQDLGLCDQWSSECNYTDCEVCINEVIRTINRMIETYEAKDDRG